MTPITGFANCPLLVKVAIAEVLPHQAWVGLGQAVSQLEVVKLIDLAISLLKVGNLSVSYPRSDQESYPSAIPFPRVVVVSKTEPGLIICIQPRLSIQPCCRY